MIAISDIPSQTSHIGIGKTLTHSIQSSAIFDFYLPTPL
jgi:hypothetical protein